MNHSTRKGVVADLPTILDLVTELAVFEKEPDAVTATLADYRGAFESELIYFSVAEANEQIIGFALYYMTFSTWKGRMLYLEDFYVKPQFRSAGVGESLFSTFLAEAKSRDCVLTKWQVLDWNTGAQKFYLKHGADLEKNWWNGKLFV